MLQNYNLAAPVSGHNVLRCRWSKRYSTV